MATLYIKHAWENNAGGKYPPKPSIMEWLLETDEGDPHAVTYWELLCTWAGICETIDAGLVAYDPKDDLVKLTKEGEIHANLFKDFAPRATH